MIHIPRKVLAAFIVAFCCFVVPSTVIAKCGPTCKERVAKQRCSQSSPRDCVERAILTHKLNPAGANWMRRIPACESRWSPRARNASGSSGLFQFLPSTWATTPYRSKSVWSAKWNSLAAAWMWKVGRAPGEWSCK